MKSDVWSWSILVVEIYTNGAKPFAAYTNAEVPLAVMQEGARPDRPASCPPPVFGLLEMCWSARAAQRPTFDEIVTAVEVNFGACEAVARSESYDFYHEIAEYKLTERYSATEQGRGQGISAVQGQGEGQAKVVVKKPREIKRSCIMRINKIGAGAFGEVFTAFIDEQADGGVPGYKAACKSVTDDPTGAGAKDLLAEALCMAQIQPHKNIVSLIGVVTIGQPVMMHTSPHPPSTCSGAVAWCGDGASFQHPARNSKRRDLLQLC